MRKDNSDRANADDGGGLHESPPRAPPVGSRRRDTERAVGRGTGRTSARRTDREGSRGPFGPQTPRSETEPQPDGSSAPGSVHLVGSGPGDPDLLTRRAWQRLRTADAVLHDSLTGREIVAALPESVEVVDVGKRSPDAPCQSEINDRLVERARAGETVVRLKGGDPFVFGRGGEESEHLAAADVSFEVVPGVTSAVGAPGVAGIPLTHRDHASSVTVVTGHEDPTKPESALDWDALAAGLLAGGTLVVLMGVRRLPDTVAALRGADVPRETPAAMVQKATWGDQQTITGTLETIVDRRDEADVTPPAVTVIGDVVSVRETVERRLQEW